MFILEIYYVIYTTTYNFIILSIVACILVAKVSLNLVLPIPSILNSLHVQKINLQDSIHVMHMCVNVMLRATILYSGSVIIVWISNKHTHIYTYRKHTILRQASWAIKFTEFLLLKPHSVILEENRVKITFRITLFSEINYARVHIILL